MGIDDDLVLLHGIRWEIFVMPIADNAQEFLRGVDAVPTFRRQRTAGEISQFARERWIVPRGRRLPEYRDDSRASIIDDLQLEEVKSARAQHPLMPL